MAISMLAKTVPRGMITNGKVARIQFSVKDNGIRISAEDQVKLFEPYSFVTSGWVQKAGVSGLGHSMAKRYVEGVGGTIGVESTEGEGSTFFFSVPFPLVPFDPSIDCAHSQLYSESSNQHLCVLGMACKSKLPKPQGWKTNCFFLGGATMTSVSWTWRASPNSPSLRDGRQIAFSGRHNHYFCVLDMARRSKLPEPCVPVPIDEQIHGSYVAVHNWGAKKNEEHGSPSPLERAR